MKKVLFTAVAMLGLTAATHAQVPNYVPTNGLVAWWPFNGNADDGSGNGYNGIVYSASSLGPSNISVSCWYKLVGGNSNQSLIRRRGSGFQISYNLTAIYGSPASNKLNTWFWPNSTQFYNPILNNTIDNVWHNLVFTFDGLNYIVYLDGIQVYTTNSFGPGGLFSGDEFVIGRDGSVSNWYYNGFFDDLGIWNRALSQEEITALYNAETCASNTSITPQTNALPIGSTATFTATTSDPNPNYVWQSDLGQGFQTLSDVGNYTGTSTATLNLANVQLSEHNQPIRVITTSGECIDTSEVAVISILDTCITSIFDTSLVSVTDTLIINTLITEMAPPVNSNTIKVFPNPANTHISIDYGNFALMNGYELRIENSLGQQVFQTNITQQSDFLSLATWGGNGLYFVHIVDPQGNTVDIRKIVLQ